MVGNGAGAGGVLLPACLDKPSEVIFRGICCPTVGNGSGFANCETFKIFYERKCVQNRGEVGGHRVIAAVGIEVEGGPGFDVVIALRGKIHEVGKSIIRSGVGRYNERIHIFHNRNCVIRPRNSDTYIEARLVEYSPVFDGYREWFRG